MSRRDTPRDGFFSKVLVATIVVIWVALVGGNWIGRVAIEKGFLGKAADQGEFKAMPGPRPKPWLSVDPKIQRELEKGTGITPAASTTPSEEESTPAALATPATPAAPADAPPLRPAEELSPTPATKTPQATPSKPTPKETAAVRSVRPATPAAPKFGEPKATPAEPPPTPLAEAPKPTPKDVVEPTPALVATPATPAAAAHSGSSYQLQFGSFSSAENAKRLQEELSRKGQEARVEEIQTTNGKVFRVRGGTYDEGQAHQQLDKLKEQNVDAYIVNP